MNLFSVLTTHVILQRGTKSAKMLTHFRTFWLCPALIKWFLFCVYDSRTDAEKRVWPGSYCSTHKGQKSLKWTNPSTCFPKGRTALTFSSWSVLVSLNKQYMYFVFWGTKYYPGKREKEIFLDCWKMDRHASQGNNNSGLVALHLQRSFCRVPLMFLPAVFFQRRRQKSVLMTPDSEGIDKTSCNILMSRNEIQYITYYKTHLLLFS